MITLDVQNLESGYGEVKVLWGVSIKVKKGELTTIIGSNGSGKTTFLKAIMGIIPVWNGKIIFNGEDVTKLSTHSKVEKGIVMIPEGRLIFPEMSVLENLEMGAYTKRAMDRMQDSLDLVFSLFPRLKERIQQKAGTLSGGEQQMLAVARGLMSVPEILILDEPSLGLAPKLTIEIFETIKKLKNEGVTMLLVEQNVHLSLAITDYAYVMAEGKIVLEGTGEELERSDEVRKAYLGI
ncbi:MAG: ABC transporter ATP-binding protein [Archaeoglobaceae archaeon]|nr:ABC transporter ATP-binding protein [Archaeoglobaceae archaeon]HDD36321.1 ABC transporter ATP-binding protein [Archaeoglobus veneficus]